MQSLMVSHELRDDRELAALGAFKSFLAHCFRSKTFGLTVDRQMRMMSAWFHSELQKAFEPLYPLTW